MASSGLPAVSREKNVPESQIINPLLTEFFWSRWLDIGQVRKPTKKEQGRYPAILTEKAWSIKDLLFGFRGMFSHRTGLVVPSGQDGSIMPGRVANHSARFGSSCPLAELAI